MRATHHETRSGKGLILPVLAVVFAFAAAPLHASWEYIPPEVRMIEADMVVAGEIVKPGKKLKKYGQVYEVAIIKPLQLLKGDTGKQEQIRLAWPAIAPALPAPRIGDRSIWVLRADEILPVYRATYLTDRQPLEKLAEVRDRLSAIETIRWSEPKDGLQMGIFTEQRDLSDATIRQSGNPVEAIVRLAVYPLMKNISDRPIYVNMFKYDRPFSILCHAPSGRPMDVPTYVASPEDPAFPERKHFVLVPPGAVRSSSRGFALPVLTESGTYSIRIRYKSNREAAELQLGPVWKGAMASPTIAVQVPAREDEEW